MADEVSLRVAAAGDGAALLALLKKVEQSSHSVIIPNLDSLTAEEEDQQLDLISQQANCLVLVAVLKSDIIGLVTVMPPADSLQAMAASRIKEHGLSKQVDLFTGELGIVVDPAFQRQGLGAALVSEAQYWLAHYSRLDAIVLTVFNDNQPARALYHHAHFIDVGPVIEESRPATMMVWLP